jgi:hypothetical protein
MKVSKLKLRFVISFFIFSTILVSINTFYSENQILDEAKPDLINFMELETSDPTLLDAWKDNNGTIICNETSSSPVICTDGDRGAIIAWTDSRGANTDIYAQRISSTGTTLWTDDGIAVCTTGGDQMSPQICSDGVGGAIITWSDGRNGAARSDIYALRIDSDGGIHTGWSINGAGIYVSAGVRASSPQIICDGVEGAIITWHDNFTGNNDIAANRITGSGAIHASWLTGGETITSVADDQWYPEICSDGDEGAIITWTDERAGGANNNDIYAQRIDKDATIMWTANGEVISNHYNKQEDPQIASDQAGGAFITWEDNRDGLGMFDVYAQRIDSTGTTIFTANGTAICNADENQFRPRICSSGTGGAIIAWDDARNLATGPDIYAQRINNVAVADWTINGTIICDNSYSQTNVKLCRDGAAGAIIIWEDLRGGGSTEDDVYAQHITYQEDKLWTPNGMVVSNAADEQNRAVICSDGYGGAIVAWRDERSGSTDIYAEQVGVQNILVSSEIMNQKDARACSDGAGGVFIVWVDERAGTSQDDIYAQHIAANGTIFGNPNGTVICNEAGIQENPEITQFDTSTAIITWKDERAGGTVDDIYAQRIGPSVATYWTDNGTLVCNALGQQLNPKILSWGGFAIITWQDERAGTTDDNIYVQALDKNGAIFLGDNGTVVCDASREQRDPNIIRGNIGEVIITWEDDRSVISAMNIRAQKILLNGTALWTSNGVPIISVVFDQENPRLCSDGAGGAIIVWRDYRNTDWDIYTQRIDENGTLLWGVKLICDATGVQKEHQICSDNAGGAIISWSDERLGTGVDDIYAQHINASGDILWADNGKIICNATNEQFDPVISSDGGGGAIIVWQDERLGDSQDGIYAQRIDSNGDLKYSINGSIISEIRSFQHDPYIVCESDGDAFVAWEDRRSAVVNGLNLYMKYLFNEAPTSNSPADITTDTIGSETIDWILSDDFGGGDYRVLVNSSAYIDWTSWTSGTNLQIAINRTVPGMYEYKIEYYDDQSKNGLSDTVIVNNTNEQPTTDQPADIYTVEEGSETIDWTLTDTAEGGQYRVIANNSVGSYYTWIDWTPWSSVANLQIPINRTIPGIYNYTIEYYDNQSTYGIPDTVIVNFTNELPNINQPADLSTIWNGTETINWDLSDDSSWPGGQYRVISNYSGGGFYVWIGWTPWTSVENLNIAINRTAPGIFNYTIELYDNRTQYGIPDTVIVTVNDTAPYVKYFGLDPIPTGAGDGATIPWQLYDEYGTGQYRVWSNNSAGDEYLWQNWTVWGNGSNLAVIINRSLPGDYYFKIQYYDNNLNYGVNHTVIVTVADLEPWSNQPADIITTQDETYQLCWSINDDFGGGYYRVLVFNQETGYNYSAIDWTAWTGVKTKSVCVPLNRSMVATLIYTIEYYDNYSNSGDSDEVTVSVKAGGSPGEPPDLTLIIIAVIAAVAGVAVSLVVLKTRGGGKKRAKMIHDFADGADKNYMFVSYATVDSKLFQIPKISEILTSYPEIDDVLFWEDDMHDDIFAYMDENLKRCKVILLFCTANSNASDPVKMEWRSGLKLERKVIPIFIDASQIPALLTTKLGIQFDPYNFYDTVEQIYQLILKKLEIPSTRNIFNYIIPKEIGVDNIEREIAPMKEEKNILPSDATLSEAINQTNSLLQANNLHVLQKEGKLFGFGQYKHEKINVAVSAEILETEGKVSIIIKTMSEKEWLLAEITKVIMRKQEEKPQEQTETEEVKPDLKAPKKEIKPVKEQVSEIKKLEPEPIIIEPEPSIEEIELKNKINTLEAEVKQLLEQKNNVKAAQLMYELGEYYKQIGDNVKAEQIFEYQRNLVITGLKQMRSNLVNQASKAEDEGNWQVAKDSWAQCRDISQKLYRDGLGEEAENIKKFEDLEIKCNEELNKVSEPIKPSETVKDEETLKKEAMIKKFDDYIETLNAAIRDLDNQFRTGQISQEYYIENKNKLAGQIGEAQAKRDQIKG